MEETNTYRIRNGMIRLEKPRHRLADGKMYHVEAG